MRGDKLIKLSACGAEYAINGSLFVNLGFPLVHICREGGSIYIRDYCLLLIIFVG